MATDPEILRAVARKYLTLDERRDVEDCLDNYFFGSNRDIGATQWYIMQAIESHCRKGHISTTMAQSIYDEIGVCPIKQVAPPQQLQLFLQG